MKSWSLFCICAFDGHSRKRRKETQIASTLLMLFMRNTGRALFLSQQYRAPIEQPSMMLQKSWKSDAGSKQAETSSGFESAILKKQRKFTILCFNPATHCNSAKMATAMSFCFVMPAAEWSFIVMVDVNQ